MSRIDSGDGLWYNDGMAAGERFIQRGTHRAKPQTSLTPEKIATFLDWIAEGWSTTYAAAQIGVSVRVLKRYRENDEEFRLQWEDAVESGTDMLEDEARRRAQEGVPEPVFYQGEVVGTIQRFSDQMLISLLKARRPHKFRERVDLTGKDGGPLEIQRIVEGAAESLAAKLAPVIELPPAVADDDTG